MRQLIFKNFSSDPGLDSLELIRGYVDTSNIDRIFSNYQEAVYGSSSSVLIVSPMVRLRYVSQDNYPIDSLLLYFDILKSLLDGLENIKFVIREKHSALTSWKRVFNFFNRFDARTYNQAYTRVAVTLP